MPFYIKKKVLIEGTNANPETFQTGFGKLETDVFGAPFPPFDSRNQAIHIDIGGSYQEAGVNLAGFSAITDYGTLTFKLAISDAGKPSQDGKFYADLAFFVQNRC
jgi:hypothetical protein